MWRGLQSDLALVQQKSEQLQQTQAYLAHYLSQVRGWRSTFLCPVLSCHILYLTSPLRACTRPASQAGSSPEEFMQSFPALMEVS